MKNALLLTAPHEIDAHVRGLWRTDLFRESHDDPCGYIRNWVQRFARIPRIFFEMTVPAVEHSHFAPWFGAMHYRSYSNPHVHDLFVFHELAHAASLADDYDEGYAFQQWAQRLYDNELRVALESECLIYWEIPGLRRHTFEFEIWADRFLDKPMRSRRQLFIERRRAMRDPADEVERQMAGYPTQNERWAAIWRERYAQVEAAMRRLVDDALADRSLAGQRHLSWLLHETGMTAERPYPFPDEAEAFAEVYVSTKLAVGSPDTGSGDVPLGAVRLGDERP
jgi:hypothetical protein